MNSLYKYLQHETSIYQYHGRRWPGTCSAEPGHHLINWWVGARKTQLHCWRTGVMPFLRWPTMYHRARVSPHHNDGLMQERRKVGFFGIHLREVSQQLPELLLRTCPWRQQNNLCWNVSIKCGINHMSTHFFVNKSASNECTRNHIIFLCCKIFKVVSVA